MEETATLCSSSPYYWAQLACSAFFAILFLQSGFDKVFNFRDNLSWLTGHFEKTFLGPLVPVLVVLITITEVSAGLLSVFGVAELLIFKTAGLAFAGAAVSTLSLLLLFFGQRIAKDYAGATSLVAYFLVAVAALLITG